MTDTRTSPPPEADPSTPEATGPGAELSASSSRAPGPASRSLWRHRDFVLLWSSQTISEMGTRISAISVPLLAASTLHATTFQVSLITALTWLPYLFFALPAGVIVDRVRKRRLMIWCDLVRFGLMASVPVAAFGWELTLAHVYVAVSLCGVLTVFFNVAYRTQLPLLVSQEQLVEGNGKLETSESVAELIGPAGGGLLVGLLGAVRTIMADALSFVLSALMLCLIRGDRSVDGEVDEDERVPFRAALRDGLGFVLGHPLLRRLLATSSTSNFFVMGMTGIEILYLVDELEASPFVVGLVFTVGTIGGLVTGLLAPRLTERIGTARVIWVAMAAPGPLYLLIPLATPGWGVVLYAIGLTAFSANTVLYNAAEASYRQRITPPELMGRANASVLWVCFGVIPLGAVFGGALATWAGLRVALLVCVLGMWSASLFVVFSPLRRMRDFAEEPGELVAAG
ncbi:MFS transporter [Streptomyces sp. NPDC088923]|uniref:MFS transporter n=1 Tax=Streptomyces sp. NPDC088923 TaxID=3365913 RepID=UPI003815EB38